jgi:hypothetical protein
LKLRRVERDGVRQIFAPDEVDGDRLIRGRGERETAARDEGRQQNDPDVPRVADDARGDQKRERERRQARARLRDQEQTLAVDAVGIDAAQKRQHEAGRSGRESIDAEPEGGVGQLQDEPALCDRLHPCADIRQERARPEKTEVAMRESTKHLARTRRRRHA